MDIQIRPYRSTDFETLVPMVLDMHRVNGISHLMKEQFAKTVSEFESHPDKGEILVIANENTNMGYAILVFFWSNDWTGNIVFLDELFVASTYRDQGIGNMFLAYLKDRFSSNSTGIMLETTPEKERAANLYQRFGFVPAVNNFWQYMFREIIYPE